MRARAQALLKEYTHTQKVAFDEVKVAENTKLTNTAKGEPMSEEKEEKKERKKGWGEEWGVGGGALVFDATRWWRKDWPLTASGYSAVKKTS